MKLERFTRQYGFQLSLEKLEELEELAARSATEGGDACWSVEELVVLDRLQQFLNVDLLLAQYNTLAAFIHGSSLASPILFTLSHLVTFYRNRHFLRVLKIPFWFLRFSHPLHVQYYTTQ